MNSRSEVLRDQGDAREVPTKDEVLRRVIERYGSLERPDFHWVQIAYDRDPYADLRRKLSERFDLTDITDLNSDVSFAYELRSREGDGAWTLRLSMVAPYAALIRHAPRMPAEAIVDGPRDAKSGAETFIVEACHSVGCEVLHRDVLGLPVRLRLFETAPERVRAYQALFSDIDFLPGEYGGARNA